MLLRIVESNDTSALHSVVEQAGPRGDHLVEDGLAVLALGPLDEVAGYWASFR
ncbi:MAG: hypothetical protein IPI73_07250 [Betaproteobacteria bacterium]|nr:hypothetical protein [Betaproteobacteria bacterium]